MNPTNANHTSSASPPPQTEHSQTNQPISPCFTPDNLPEPEFFDFFQQERLQATSQGQQAVQELEACKQERIKLLEKFLEVEEWGIHVWNWRQQVEYKINKADEAIKIIDDESANNNNSNSNNNITNIY